MSKKKATAISLPISRTAKIMTSAVGVETVSQDAVAIATKATEIFLTDFARRAYELSDSNILDYDDITRLVHSDPRYDFIVDTTPKRIKFSEALKLIEDSKKRGSGDQEQPENKSPSPPPPQSVEPEDKQPNESNNEEEEETGSGPEDGQDQNGRQGKTPESPDSD